MSEKQWKLKINETGYTFDYSKQFFPDLSILSDGSSYFLISEHVPESLDPTKAFHRLYTLLRMINGATILASNITYKMMEKGLYLGNHAHDRGNYNKTHWDKVEPNPFISGVGNFADPQELQLIPHLIYESKTNAVLSDILVKLSSFKENDFWSDIYKVFELVRDDLNPKGQNKIDSALGKNRRMNFTQTCNYFRHEVSQSNPVINELEALNFAKELTVYWLGIKGFQIKFQKSEEGLDFSGL